MTDARVPSHSAPETATPSSAQILLFTGIRRDRAGQMDTASLVAAAVLAGRVRRFPAGLRALPPPMAPALRFLENPAACSGGGMVERRPGLAVYDGEDGP